MSNYSRKEITFHNNEESTTAEGKILEVGSEYDTLQIECDTDGSCKLTFYGMSLLNTWRPILASKMVTNLELVNSTEDTEPFYRIDLTCLSKVKVRLENNTGKTTVIGKIVG